MYVKTYTKDRSMTCLFFIIYVYEKTRSYDLVLRGIFDVFEDFLRNLTLVDGCGSHLY